MRRIVLALALTLFTAPAAAQTETPVVLLPDDLEWTEMAPGIAFAPAYGDWTAGAHGKFVRFAPGAHADLHTHSAGYSALVVVGSFTNVYPDDAAVTPMPPGSYWFTPGGKPHANTCVSEEPCILYTHSDSAFDFAPAQP